MNDFAGLYAGRYLQADLSAESESQILAIGDIDVWRRNCGEIPQHVGLVFRDISDLTAELLAGIAPELVVSPTVAPRFDCLDVAYRLCALNYRGAYRALARNFPSPEIIRREVRAACRDLDFDIVQIANPAATRLI